MLTTDDKVFYNRTSEIGYENPKHGTVDSKEVNEAVIANANGTGTYRVIPHATWVGASTNGQGPTRAMANLMYVGSQITGFTKSLDFSEVFLVTEENDNPNNDHHSSDTDDFMVLKAVSAANPTDGIVTLGDLPQDTNTPVRMHEYGRGPHRLIRYAPSNKKRGILYVNTHEKNSLKVLDKGHRKTNIVRGF